LRARLRFPSGPRLPFDREPLFADLLKQESRYELGQMFTTLGAALNRADRLFLEELAFGLELAARAAEDELGVLDCELDQRLQELRAYSFLGRNSPGQQAVARGMKG
jgi:hypothetical protein